MHFKELMKSRYAVREYFENKVDRTLLKEVVNAGRLAPSAANRQPWQFVVVDDDVLLAKLKDSYQREWFGKVPNLIIIYGNHEESWKRPYDNKDHCDIDVAIAVDHMTLMATELGLGTCWVCHFDKDIINSVIENKKGFEPIAILTIGYPVDNTAPIKKRKNLDEVLSFNGL
ncbi:nitroreductase family protein [Plebeiibacterium marinum]|uniref:Nitroreductase family protein n=1 Tax=Plebeiibacterium marinum TaxID=2992111 RepID=A0AAE3SHY9_9BACT|nr:nitroreductase family protein [Plebeiobacterium marinum]MCW3804185.1 nitroreductase family protein [Plebeiobacterium marinum]